jgi:16S rRNA (uracil1498-N3)-methyltransferase
MTPRFFCPQPLHAGAEIALPGAAAHHAERVLRLAPGAEVVLFDGAGMECRAQLTALGRAPRARVLETCEPRRESPLSITLVQALASSDKMDWIVQKATELGVAALVPIAAERSVLKLAGERAEKRLEHWRQVVVSACEQCGRNRLPEVLPVQALVGYLAEAPRELPRLILAPGAATALADLPPAPAVHVLIGPEGGWAPAELEAAAAAGCTPLRLGPRVLRTETAGLAASAALQALWGDFRN